MLGSQKINPPGMPPAGPKREMKLGQFAIGQSVPRTEDPRLVTGRGKYLDDFVLPGQCHAIFLRSPHAHARILACDTSEAIGMPGVVAIFTGEDLAPDGLGVVPPLREKSRRDGSPAFRPPRPPLAHGRVLVVGDPVAVVIAETQNLAKDAAERIVVEYDPLPALTDTTTAIRPGELRLWDGCEDNEAFFQQMGDRSAVDAAFARADHVTSLRLVFNRVTHATMETRGCIGDYDGREDRYTLYTATQRPHAARTGMAKYVLRIPETKMRVVAGDVGGSFGLRGDHYPEYTVCVWAAKRVGRPVKWVAERSEGMITDDQDRDHIVEASLALDREGKFLALRAANATNIGAYLAPAGLTSATTHLGGLAGTYTTPAIYVETAGYFSNTAGNGPYRGSGRPEASYIVERLIDNAARDLGMDRAEIRRRNTIPAEAMPFKTGLTFHYDCGDFPRNLERALAMADYPGFEKRREEAKRRGMLRGLGMANIIEQAAAIFGETVHMRFDPSGTLSVIPGSISQGQGHDTMYKILMSDKFGLDSDDIRVALGNDTDVSPDGGGTYGSRTAVLGGSAAIIAADRIIEKGSRIAAHIMEAAVSDVEFSKGAFRVGGTDRSVSLAEVARAAHIPSMLPKGMETGLADTASFAPEVPTFPNGCHVCELEIDPETGSIRLEKYVVVDDVGTVINHLTLEGQIHGGIVQGIGQVFGEHLIYDPETGQILTGSFMDYRMPRADDTCEFEMESQPVPTKKNPIGAKGAGESGNVGALAALMNAVVDALSPYGVTHMDMPATPEKVWRAIRAAEGPR